ncbi:Acyl-CoA hydrolase [Halogranum gelatinilyticum]|uniref:Acyl-CoA hydrolase n=1 Tax=Halogranum gelatinilyticum TaxID=660521 RepID=A0A1G9TP21_9EURY|nr:acyl-CoA thioesterase [Halogranum gelatinilyticum]SDM49497.1 Acyl-CoA hydrolase [Halogranum gelatinilyticum]
MVTAHADVTLLESYTEMTQILMPNDTNNMGRALGGSILHWMDICGAVTGRRFAHNQVVTASMDHVDFTGAIDLGDIVRIEGYVFDTGETSLDIRVDVVTEVPETGARRDTASSFFTFVAIDEDEQPTAVPNLACPTSEERSLRQYALDERASRRRELVEKVQVADD